MCACIILHNIIIDDERDDGYDNDIGESHKHYSKGGAFDFWIDIFEPLIWLDRACVEQVLLD
jgi:hypothetical protein